MSWGNSASGSASNRGSQANENRSESGLSPQTYRLEGFGSGYGGLARAIEEAKGEYGTGDVQKEIEKLKPRTQFFVNHLEEDGTISRTDEVIVDSRGRINVNGRLLSEDNAIAANQLRKRLTRGNISLSSDMPDTRSALNINGKKVYTHSGIDFRNGTYDTIVGRRTANGREIRKVARRGQIGEYNGELYGITKKAGQYSVTHVGSGYLVGTAKTMGEAAGLIKKRSSLVTNNRQLRKMEEALKNAVRGD